METKQMTMLMIVLIIGIAVFTIFTATRPETGPEPEFKLE